MSLNIDSVCEKRVFWSKDIVCAPLELPQNNGSSWPVASSHTFSGSFNGADFPSNRPLPLLYNSYHVPQMSVAQPLFNKRLL